MKHPIIACFVVLFGLSACSSFTEDIREQISGAPKATIDKAHTLVRVGMTDEEVRGLGISSDVSGIARIPYMEIPSLMLETNLVEAYQRLLPIEVLECIQEGPQNKDNCYALVVKRRAILQKNEAPLYKRLAGVAHDFKGTEEQSVIAFILKKAKVVYIYAKNKITPIRDKEENWLEIIPKPWRIFGIGKSRGF